MPAIVSRSNASPRVRASQGRRRPPRRSRSCTRVRSPYGASVIAPVDPAGIEVLQQRLYSPGEMLRMNHLEPAPAHPSPTSERAFSEVGSA